MTRTTTLLLACMACVLAGASGFAQAAGPQAQGPAPVYVAAGPDTAAWRDLSPAQQKLLKPLAKSWGAMDDTQRSKWVNVVDRYDRLTPAQQARVRERIQQWSSLPAKERNAARLRYQEVRQMPVDERQRKWAAYRALPESQRQELVRQAIRRANPVYLPPSSAGPREAPQLYGSKPAAHVPSGKRVDAPVLPRVQTPQPVAPGLVRSGPGATTTLVNQRPSPPLYQQSGMPRISATQTFVDPVTMLPRRGAQGAGMAPRPDTPSARPNGHPPRGRDR